MAEFKRSYEENEQMEGDYSNMTDGTGLGTGFVGGLIVGGLAGWAFSRNRGDYPYGGYGYGAPVAFNACNCGCGCNRNEYSIADVSNLIATKDAQYAQLNATQASEFNILNTMSRDNTAMAKDLCGLAYENAMLSNQVQGKIAEASAKADLCCCQTQGLVKETACATQGMVAQIVPQMQNFYLADEVEKLRIKSVKTENAYQFGALTSQLSAVGHLVHEVYDKVNTPATTTTAAA